MKPTAREKLTEQADLYALSQTLECVGHITMGLAGVEKEEVTKLLLLAIKKILEKNYL